MSLKEIVLHACPDKKRKTCHTRFGALKDTGYEAKKITCSDFLMRNTDRGADNYMLKYCEGNNERSLIDIAPSRSSTSTMPVMRELPMSDSLLATIPSPPVMHLGSPRSPYLASQEPGTSLHARLPHLHVRSIELFLLQLNDSHAFFCGGCHSWCSH